MTLNITSLCSFSFVWLFVTPWTLACQALLSLEFSRQEYWSGLPFLSPDGAWFSLIAGRFFTTEPLGKPQKYIVFLRKDAERKTYLSKRIIFNPYFNMNLLRVYTCSPSWISLPPPSLYHPSGSSQCTSPEHPVSCIEPGLVIRFTYDIIYVSMPFSQIIPPSPSPTEYKRLFYTSVSLLLFHIQSLPSF